NEQSGQEKLEPERPRVFVAMDHVQDLVAGHHGGTRGAEMEFGVAAIGAFEGGRDGAGVRQTAAVAEGWLDEPDLVPAVSANKSLRRCRASRGAELAGFGIEKAQSGVEP